MFPSSSVGNEIEVRWVTRSYRTVILFGVLLLTVLGALGYYRYQDILRDFLRRRIAATVRLAVPQGHRGPASRSAAFLTNLDGVVRTKSTHSKLWIEARSGAALLPGDLVETSDRSTATATFAEGMAALLMPETVLHIQKNTTDPGHHTQLRLELIAGSMDFSVSPQNTGCDVRVVGGGATFLVLSGSRVLLRNDPRLRRHEVVVRTGRVEVLRDQEDVPLVANQQLQFRDDSSSMQPQDLPESPRVQAPEDSAILVVSDDSSRARFAWYSVDRARYYRLRISRDRYFSTGVFERKVEGTEIQLAGLTPGEYHWTIQSLDEAGHESAPGDVRHFTVSSDNPMALVLERAVAHQQLVEVSGRTDPGARLLVNGEQVLVNADGSFRHSTTLVPGTQIVSVTAQNAAGAVITRQAAVDIR